MTQRLVLLGFLFAALQLGAWAQGGDQPGPAPRDFGPPPIRLSGRVIADSTRQPDEIIEVRLEASGGARIASAYTETAGEFDFRPVVLDPANFYFVVVEFEGHLPFRERLDHLTNIRSGAPIVIFLEAAEVEVSESRPDEPVVDVRQLGAVIPDEAHSEYEAAIEDVAQGEYPSAISRLERAIELAPDFFEALNSLGGQYVRVGRHREAEAVLNRALELSPASTAPLVNLGVLHYQEGQALRESGDAEAAQVRFSRAVDVLDRAVRNRPLDATAHHYIGAALYETGEFDRAEAMLNLAIELDSEPEEARLVLVNLFTRQERFEEALEQVTVYLERNPSSPMRPSLEELRSQIESRIQTAR